MKTPLLFLPLIFYTAGFSQNLVINPSFEDTTQCPDFVSQIDRAVNWSTTNLTPDYYHVCNNTSQTNPGMVGVPFSARGYQPARTGDAMAGVVIYYTSQTNYREVFQAPLSQPLQNGVTYDVGMWVVLNEDNAMYAIDGGLGIYLSNAPINPSQLFSYTPQIMNPNGNVLNDSLNWTLISGTYTATGGESYITIGGFLPDNLLTIFNRGGTYNFTSYAIDDVYVIPDVSTSVNDHVTVNGLSVFPNPASELVQLVFKDARVKDVFVEVFNMMGERVYVSQENNFQGGGIQVPVRNLAKGIYCMRVTAGAQVFYKKITKE
jgi:OmpA-OmpF porin, OOP family